MLIPTSIDKITETLRSAISEDVRGIVNDEGRSALDFLITCLQADTSLKREAWLSAIITLVDTDEQKPRGWWRSLERFVVLSNLNSKELGASLESALMTQQVDDPLDRASLYDLLDVCGKPPLSSRIASDENLKQAEPLRWLDLMLARVPSDEESQRLVLEAAELGHFTLTDFVQRLEEMRSIGGEKLAIWLKRFRRTLPLSQHSEYDAIVKDVFGADLHGGDLDEIPSTKAPEQVVDPPVNWTLDILGDLLLPGINSQPSLEAINLAKQVIGGNAVFTWDQLLGEEASAEISPLQQVKTADQFFQSKVAYLVSNVGIVTALSDQSNVGAPLTLFIQSTGNYDPVLLASNTQSLDWDSYNIRSILFGEPINAQTVKSADQWLDKVTLRTLLGRMAYLPRTQIQDQLSSGLR